MRKLLSIFLAAALGPLLFAGAAWGGAFNSGELVAIGVAAAALMAAHRPVGEFLEFVFSE